MAQSKQRKPRESKVTPEETAIQKQVDTLSEKKNRTDAESKHLKTLRVELGKHRFVRLAIQRVPRAVKVVKGIGNLSGAGYTYTPEQAEKIVNALKAAVEVVADKFSGATPTADKFTL